MAVSSMRLHQQQLLNVYHLGSPAPVVVRREDVMTCYIKKMLRRTNREYSLRLDYQVDIFDLLSSDFVPFLARLYNCSSASSLRYTSAAFHLSSPFGADLIPVADIGIIFLALNMQPLDIVNLLDVMASKR